MTDTSARPILRMGMPPLVVALALTACDAEQATDAGGSGSTEQCVLGYWLVDNDAIDEILSRLAEGSQHEDLHEVTGKGYMHFGEDGDYESLNEDFTIITGLQPWFSITNVSNSRYTGDYGVVSGDEETMSDYLWLAETDNILYDEVHMVDDDVQVFDPGDETALMGLFGDMEGNVDLPADRESVETVVPITCDGDLLTFEVEGGLTIPWHRAGSWD